jgi:ribosomal protein S18 acetylase RimI-like enzyme
MSIRPFQLPHDLDTMNALVMQGFEYPENPEWSIRADEKQGMLDRVQGAKRMWPLLRFLQFFSPIFKDIMRGFIAEEDGKPVGLINFMRQRDEPEWYIANVTVLPSHRRRGLARQLVTAVLDDLRTRKARIAILDVVDKNLPAVRLYQEMGFEIFTGSLDAELETGEAVPAPTLPDGWTLAPLSRFDWQSRFALAKRITPENVARYEPPVEARFRVPPIRPLIGSLFMKLGGDDSKRFVLHTPDGTIAGIAWHSYRIKQGGVNSAEISLDPAYPELAQFMLAHAISTIQAASPGRRIEFDFSDWQPALFQAAESFGVKKRFGAHRMGLKFQ